MSVVGLDVGNDGMCVALARKRGIDVLLNKESNRETPSVVNFGEKMRFMGTDGAAKFALAPQNTIHQLKRILGKQFDDPVLQADIAKLPFSVTRAADGGCLLNVMFLGEQAVLTPEQVMAMLLVDLKKIADVEGVSVTDCVLAVPTYYNERERYAMLNAAAIAGLNCLRLMNDNTATALSYGIYKTDLPEETAINVAFVDMGHCAIQVGGRAGRGRAWEGTGGARMHARMGGSDPSWRAWRACMHAWGWG
jgi:heat shock protein 4